jgi:hypothetical protein
MVESVHIIQILQKREGEQVSGVEIKLVNQFLDLMDDIF